MTETANPFHAGEVAAQERSGAMNVVEWAGGFIRDYMPDQHREFFAQLPFLVIASADEAGRTWVTLLDGPEGFVRSPDATTLTVDRAPDPQDPLAAALTSGTDIGMLGIELATRRRNRMNGVFRQHGDAFAIDVRQSFGNCPQHIHEREWRRVSNDDVPAARRSTALSAEQTARIRAADTLFIGTGHYASQDHASNGYDASHRGGAPGFVEVVDSNHLRIPDYAGNNFFNTIGNLLENPAIGLVFVDFESGGLLHLTGRAEIDWNASKSNDPAALRTIDVTIDAIVDRPAALSLRWSKDSASLRTLEIVDKVVESEDITSFYLAPTDARPLEPFEAGQHLPVELDIPGHADKVRRSYSLSGAPKSDRYRLSIKRESQGTASRFLHDELKAGDRISARRPSGDFVVPCSNCPLVLVSAGVGLTPMLSILHTAASEGRERPVWYVHGARNGAQHALKAEVDALVGAHANFSAHIRYSRPRDDDQLGVDYNAAGRISAQTLLELNAGPDANYLLCGPAQFLADIKSGLEAAGVPAGNIHFETFGPTG